MEEAMWCPKCGHEESQDIDLKCPECGSAMVLSDDNDRPDYEVYAEENPR